MRVNDFVIVCMQMYVNVEVIVNNPEANSRLLLDMWTMLEELCDRWIGSIGAIAMNESNE